MTKVDGVRKRIDGVETRVEGVETRVDCVQTKVDGVETRVDTVETTVEQVEATMAMMAASKKKLEVKIKAMLKENREKDEERREKDEERDAKDAERDANDALRDKCIVQMQNDIAEQKKRTAQTDNGDATAPKKPRLGWNKADHPELPKNVFYKGGSHGFGWKKITNKQKHSKAGFATMEEAKQSLDEFIDTANAMAD